MAYIYKITNLMNNKIYIGKTLNTIKKRWKEHCFDYLTRRGEKRPLYSAMKKYGIENFKIEEIEECPDEIISEREKCWIEYYGSFKYGYNATRGGDGKPYLDYDLIYSTYKNVKNIKRTAEICNCHEDSVQKIIKQKGITQEEILENKRTNSSKKVAMIDKVTGEILKVFIGTWEAGRFLGKRHQHIQQVCTGKRKSAYGYFWKYLED